MARAINIRLGRRIVCGSSACINPRQKVKVTLFSNVDWICMLRGLHRFSIVFDVEVGEHFSKVLL